ncbi:hypothetical protein OBBRIDRAFT_74281 [Obba rivulosa]|uniref:Uncharacterized protein n=1 Tax=Obba rivulosa TaxID=1052685 RepID=A0A8E2J4N2_9APHY|nr:hypothetical protein OBBRIDRAFT_74281 [Obba rivulosa]
MSVPGRRDSQLASTYVNTYNRLLQGFAPDQINPNGDPTTFWSSLLQRDVDREYLMSRLNAISKDECLGHLKVRRAVYVLRPITQISHRRSSSPS